MLIIIAIGGFVIWKRYGSTNEKADLKQYYGVESETDPALVIDDQVVKQSQNAEEGNTPDPVKVYDGSIMSNILLLIIGSISGFIGILMRTFFFIHFREAVFRQR